MKSELYQRALDIAGQLKIGTDGDKRLFKALELSVDAINSMKKAAG